MRLSSLARQVGDDGDPRLEDSATDVLLSVVLARSDLLPDERLDQGSALLNPRI